jgi:hypothetical protein
MNRWTTNHWGSWVRHRAHCVGFKTMGALARAVGCRNEQISRWLAHAEPPAQMRKGFDRALADALQTNHATLFAGFRSIAPEDASFTTGAEFAPISPNEFRRKIGALVELLPADKLRDFYRAGEAILKGEPAAA